MRLSMYDKNGLASTVNIEKKEEALKEVFFIERNREPEDRIVLVIVYDNNGRKVYTAKR